MMRAKSDTEKVVTKLISVARRFDILSRTKEADAVTKIAQSIINKSFRISEDVDFSKLDMKSYLLEAAKDLGYSLKNDNVDLKHNIINSNLTPEQISEVVLRAEEYAREDQEQAEEEIPDWMEDYRSGD